uniref:Uncharacterized protein n=1 Tax=viral metagenome TaxID=1070528 RepID=A0A6C0AI03_9ZZZZ
MSSDPANDTGADLSKNSIWGDIQNAVGSAETSLMGPAYSYSDNIPTTSQLHVGPQGSFSQLYTNLNAVGTYVDTLLSGNPPLGNQFFVNTGSTCTAPDGSIQARYNYINNIPPSGALLGQGLVGGVVGDIEGLNPTYLFNSIMSASSPACKCYKCDVTTGDESQFLTPDLSPDFSPDRCKEVDISNCPVITKSTEEFVNNTFAPTLIAGISLCLILLLRK